MNEIWLEVANVKITNDRAKTSKPEGTNTNQTNIEVQLRGDRHPEHPQWWLLPGTFDQFKALVDALEKKRPVLAQVVAEAGTLKVKGLTIQFTDTNVRS